MESLQLPLNVKHGTVNAFFLLFFEGILTILIVADTKIANVTLKAQVN